MMRKLAIVIFMLFTIVFAQTQYFTEKELATFNGQEGSPAYVAISGSVYDVSNKEGWDSGAYMGYNAGQDLSMYIPSVNGEAIVSGSPLIGKLVNAMSSRMVAKTKNKKLIIRQGLVLDISTTSIDPPVIGKIVN